MSKPKVPSTKSNSKTKRFETPESLHAAVIEWAHTKYVDHPLLSAGDPGVVTNTRKQLKMIAGQPEERRAEHARLAALVYALRSCRHHGDFEALEASREAHKVLERALSRMFRLRAEYPPRGKGRAPSELAIFLSFVRGRHDNDTLVAQCAIAGLLGPDDYENLFVPAKTGFKYPTLADALKLGRDRVRHALERLTRDS
jgi:hypothetical protein